MPSEIEIEEKFWLVDRHALIAAVESAGYAYEGVESQTDIYFVDSDYIYLKDNTCLRIRHREGSPVATLDYKGPSSESTRSVIGKVETNIAFDAVGVDELVRMLEALGFIKYVTVRKKRDSWLRALPTFSFRIAIDTVENAGEFVEVEGTSPAIEQEHDLSNAWQSEVGKIRSLLGEPVIEPYRDLVAC